MATPKKSKLKVDIYYHQAYYATIKIPYPETITQAYIREHVLDQHPELIGKIFQTQYFKYNVTTRP